MKMNTGFAARASHGSRVAAAIKRFHLPIPSPVTDGVKATGEGGEEGGTSNAILTKPIAALHSISHAMSGLLYELNA